MDHDPNRWLFEAIDKIGEHIQELCSQLQETNRLSKQRNEQLLQAMENDKSRHIDQLEFQTVVAKQYTDSPLREVAERLVGLLEGDSMGPTLDVPLGILRELDGVLKGQETYKPKCEGRLFRNLIQRRCVLDEGHAGHCKFWVEKTDSQDDLMPGVIP